MAFTFRASANWCHDFPKLARESGFYFSVQTSRVRVDWNRIININIDQVIKDRDFSVVDENVNNVINYCLESEYDIKILDPNFVKLFRLAQLAVEYLLYCKQYLDHSVVILKDELKQKIEENVKLKKETATLEEIIKQLKEKPREKGRFLEAKIGDCNGEIYKCPHCPKTFISPMFLNAHVTRRHAYISGLCFTSPIPEHYHTETEKLHNEIKSLKERLNEAEKVLKKESDKTCCKTNVEGRLSGNEMETSRRDSNKFGEYQDHKGYIDEISTLKSMLFEEIRNLRQKDRMMYEYSPETNVQTLISQQEKEFQKLTNQLLEKLTPDIENMNTKLHAQEDYWRTKIENMEYCHQKDIERLSTELKLTQTAADHIKLEYESKVTNLERHSMNQSNILKEQSQQLHSLSGVINNSPNDEWKNYKKNLPNSQSTTLQHCDSENDKEKNENDSRQKYQSNSKASQLIVADIDSASSYDSTGKLVLSVSQNKLLPKSMHTSKSPSKTITLKSNESTKRKPEYPKNSSKTFETINNVEKSFKNYDSTDMSESQDSMQDKQMNDATKRKGYDLKDRLSVTNSYFEETRRKQPEGNIANYIRTLPGDAKSATKETEILEDGVTSETETKSESVTLESQTVSESESLARNNLPVRERKTISIALPKPRNVIRHSAPYKTLEMELQELFDKRLKDLGIDPEWQGIPKATFKQKMDILMHHQKIAAKKFPKYHQVKLKLIEEVLSKISKKGRQVENVKSIKKSPLNKLVKNVKSKALKVFSNQKIPDDHGTVSKLQDTTTKKIHSKLETSKDHAQNETANSSSILSSNTNIPSSYDFIKSTAAQSTPISNYESLENQMKFFTNVTKSQEISKHLTYSRDFARTNTHDSPKKISHVFDAIQHKPPSSSKGTKSNANNDLDDTSMPQELCSVSMSPKSNKSVLKSTTGSTTSLVKKKVIFDLSNDNDGGWSLPEHTTKIEDTNDSNWNVSSVFSEHKHPLEKDDHKTTSNIVLKTSQSDKIAAISRKLEAQLSMVRQKPVGSVETLFASQYVQEQEFNNDEDQQASSDSMNSILETPRHAAMVSLKMPKDLLPHPAPRNLKGKMSASELSDLDSDIDKILKLE